MTQNDRFLDLSKNYIAKVSNEIKNIQFGLIYSSLLSNKKY